MSNIVNGRKISQDILNRLKDVVASFERKPVLAVVIVGNDKPSHNYVNKKGEAAATVGLDFLKFDYGEDITKEELIKEIKDIQSDYDLSGLIVQLPLPGQLRDFTKEVVNQIDIKVDVDCLSDQSHLDIAACKNLLLPPTASAVFQILDDYDVSLEDKKICLVGKGELVGKPLAEILKCRNLDFTICDSLTENLKEETLRADILITGVGKKNLITEEMVKEKAVVIDAGVCFEKGKMFGDVDFENIKDKASLITPVPGGVGPITVAKLLENVVSSFKRRQN
ncbi:MAG: bifunctional methylenetetrahydrofolate dehydrogenase/methenyltetrahydrofolate cyclohydrolase [Candidatus Komeilibacteria bacterium CG10_big_fil_rev_8_21_14_0_10_41_13]|uniref:Bifunctional protein FolD n=1 Tax=Candidatus Komeilibacteria bacterium CG10_big_fil_rev_8_21_14_0_10_41_13 TaxID=1974476 RepID=A0A2M6WCZ6_9BACT|nr:MAG: bifunctional methylenetetrahydrofolate dehydrogenase/methenyltetrahydrofolate cyclohydrolase [Candidatus Komeilibacteria bacterium CG10_big_fil_rev_8_21_14_0_10_41_13]